MSVSWLAWSSVDLVRAAITAVRSWLPHPCYVQKIFYSTLPHSLALTFFLSPNLHSSLRLAGGGIYTDVLFRPEHWIFYFSDACHLCICPLTAVYWWRTSLSKAESKPTYVPARISRLGFCCFGQVRNISDGNGRGWFGGKIEGALLSKCVWGRGRMRPEGLWDGYHLGIEDIANIRFVQWQWAWQSCFWSWICDSFGTSKWTYWTVT